MGTVAVFIPFPALVSILLVSHVASLYHSAGGIHTKTSDDTADDELPKTVGSALQQRSDNHDRRTEEDSLATTEIVSDPDSRNRASKASQVIRSDGNTYRMISIFPVA